MQSDLLPTSVYALGTSPGHGDPTPGKGGSQLVGTAGAGSGPCPSPQQALAQFPVGIVANPQTSPCRVPDYRKCLPTWVCSRHALPGVPIPLLPPVWAAGAPLPFPSQEPASGTKVQVMPPGSEPCHPPAPTLGWRRCQPSPQLAARGCVALGVYMGVINTHRAVISLSFRSVAFALGTQDPSQLRAAPQKLAVKKQVLVIAEITLVWSQPPAASPSPAVPRPRSCQGHPHAAAQTQRFISEPWGRSLRAESSARASP